MGDHRVMTALDPLHPPTRSSPVRSGEVRDPVGLLASRGARPVGHRRWSPRSEPGGAVPHATTSRRSANDSRPASSAMWAQNPACAAHAAGWATHPSSEPRRRARPRATPWPRRDSTSRRATCRGAHEVEPATPPEVAATARAAGTPSTGTTCRCSGETPWRCDRGAVLGRRVADVGGELPARVALLHPPHEAVARDLGDHGGGGDRGARRVAADDLALLEAGRRHREAVRQADAALDADAAQGVRQRRQVRHVQPALVDPAHAARRDRDLGRGAQDARVELLAPLRGVLLGVVERGQRAQVGQRRAARSRTAPRPRPAARPGSRARPRRRPRRSGTPSARSKREQAARRGVLRS